MQLRRIGRLARYRGQIQSRALDVFKFIVHFPKFVFDAYPVLQRRAIEEAVEESLARTYCPESTLNVPETLLNLRRLEVVEAVGDLEDVLPLYVLEFGYGGRIPKNPTPPAPSTSTEGSR